MNKVRDFAQIVGPEFVVQDPIEIRAAECTTYPTSQSIRGIVRPGSTAEVQACLALAQREGIPLYPTSTGKNWGYGSRVPVTDGCVLLDLGRLTRILDYNEELGYVTVETGVTFAQLFRFLRQEKSRLLLSVTSSAPESSVVANALERGIGSGLNADRILSACNLEVVLPTGEIVRTGFGRFGNAAAAQVHKHGVGPALDGLFVQSNLGIVTAMTLWLARRPEHLGVLFITADSAANLGSLVDKFRDAVFDHVVRPPFVLFSRDRVLSILETASSPGSSPTIPQGPPPEPPAWSGDLAVYGSSAGSLKVALTELTERFAPHAASLSVFSFEAPEMDHRLAQAECPADRPRNTDLLQLLLLDKHLGIPRLSPVRQVYWKKLLPSVAEDLNPDRDRCGLLWCSPVVPLQGTHIRQAINIVSHVADQCGLPIPTSIQCLSERCATFIASILYDRDSDGADAAAWACHEQLTGKLAQAGYYSYRENTLSLGRPRPAGAYNSTLNAIKATLDPENVLAPLRYI